MNLRFSRRKLFLFLGDLFILLFSLDLAYIIRLDRHIRVLNKEIFSILLVLCTYFISFYIFDFYDAKNKFKLNRFLLELLGALAFVSLFVTIYFYITPFQFGRGIFLISIILIGILVSTWRAVFSSFSKVAILPRRVLILGAGKTGQTIYSIINDNDEYKFMGFVDDNPKRTRSAETKILGDTHSLEKIADDYKINDIVLAFEPVGNEQLNRALINCRMKGINIYDSPTFYEHLTDKIPITFIGEKWPLYSDGFSNVGSKIYKRLKRLLDISVSLIILICILPIGLIISMVIKLSSRGPVFFTQERAGESRKSFNLIKFRTMVAGAEKGKPVWAEEADPRVTGFGKILRKSRLDEAPQLINVLKGEMSLIGPRPEREFFIKELLEKIPLYSLRFSVKPGLTGWAQVNYPYGASVEDTLEKLSYDLYYIKKMSLLLDFRILLKTIRIVLFGMGR